MSVTTTVEVLDDLYYLIERGVWMNGKEPTRKEREIALAAYQMYKERNLHMKYAMRWKRWAKTGVSMNRGKVPKVHLYWKGVVKRGRASLQERARKATARKKAKNEQGNH
jgi:uncharacterized protein YeaC (DUF1315 family)